MGVETVLRTATLARPALAAHGAPVKDHKIADGDRLDTGADLFDDAGRLMAEQEGKLVVDPASR